MLAIADEPIGFAGNNAHPYSALIGTRLAVARETAATVISWYEREWPSSCRRAELALVVGSDLSVAGVR